MPEQIRTAGFALAFVTSTAIFGGFTPAICTWLIETSGNRAAPALWLSFAAAVSLITVWLLPVLTTAPARLRTAPAE